MRNLPTIAAKTRAAQFADERAFLLKREVGVDGECSAEAATVNRHLLCFCAVLREQLFLPCWRGLGRLGPVFGTRVCGCRGFVGALEGTDRVLFVAADGDNPDVAGHLDDIIAGVSRRHELSERRLSQDDVVRQADLRHVESNELGAVDLPVPNVTGSRTCPRGTVDPSATPEKGQVGASWS